MLAMETLDGRKTLSGMERDQNIASLVLELVENLNSIRQFAQQPRPPQCRHSIAMPRPARRWGGNSDTHEVVSKTGECRKVVIPEVVIGNPEVLESLGSR